MQDAGSDKATAGITGAGSMDATNTIAVDPPFHAPGSVSAGSYRTPITPELPLFPAQADANTAGPGDRGGILHGEGGDDMTRYVFDNVNDRPADGTPWTTTRKPFNHTDI
jgi:hypothetical protein